MTSYELTVCLRCVPQVELRKAAVRLDPNQLCAETPDALDAAAERPCAAPSDAPLCTYGGTCRRLDGSVTRPLFSWPAGGAACEGRDQVKESSAGDEGHVRAPHPLPRALLPPLEIDCVHVSNSTPPPRGARASGRTSTLLGCRA